MGHFFYSVIRDGELLRVMEPRISKVKSPVDRLINDTANLGRRKAEKNYLKSFSDDVPYLM